jgi:hypothetical protein
MTPCSPLLSPNHMLYGCVTCPGPREVAPHRICRWGSSHDFPAAEPGERMKENVNKLKQYSSRQDFSVFAEEKSCLKTRPDAVRRLPPTPCASNPGTWGVGGSLFVWNAAALKSSLPII